MSDDYKKFLTRRRINVPEGAGKFKDISELSINGFSFPLSATGMRWSDVGLNAIEIPEDHNLSEEEIKARIISGTALPLVVMQDSNRDRYVVLTGIEHALAARMEGKDNVKAFVVPRSAIVDYEKFKADLENFLRHALAAAERLPCIPVSKIVIEEQIRKDIDPESLKELAESMERVGLINPITVRKEGDRYVLVAGHRRFLAARDILKWETIPARVLEEGKDTAFVQFSENVHRKDLNPVEVAEVVGRALLEELGWFGDTCPQLEESADKSLLCKEEHQNIFTLANIREKLAEKEFLRKYDRLNEKEKAAVARIMKDYAVPLSVISTSLYLCTLPEEVKQKLAGFDLKQSHYYEMLKRGIYDPEQILALARAVHEKGMTVAELKSFISKLKAEEQRKKEQASAEERFYKRIWNFGNNLRRSRILKKNPELRRKVKEYLLQLIEELEKEE